MYVIETEDRKRSDIGWIKTVLKSGTLGDKVAALTILVQDSPVHNLSSLGSLIGMMHKKSNRESLMALGNFL